jgi:hypothetical protein
MEKRWNNYAGGSDKKSERNKNEKEIKTIII